MEGTRRGEGHLPVSVLRPLRDSTVIILANLTRVQRMTMTSFASAYFLRRAFFLPTFLALFFATFFAAFLRFFAMRYHLLSGQLD